MERRVEMCTGCPFNPERTWPPIDGETRRAVAERIRAGEAWICHQSCDGARVTPASELCAGAPSR